MDTRRTVSGKAAGFTLLLVLAAIAAILIYRAHHTPPVSPQVQRLDQISHCTLTSNLTWQQCAKIYGG